MFPCGKVTCLTLCAIFFKKNIKVVFLINAPQWCCLDWSTMATHSFGFMFSVRFCTQCFFLWSGCIAYTCICMDLLSDKVPHECHYFLHRRAFADSVFYQPHGNQRQTTWTQTNCKNIFNDVMCSVPFRFVFVSFNSIRFNSTEFYTPFETKSKRCIDQIIAPIYLHLLNEPSTIDERAQKPAPIFKMHFDSWYTVGKQK